MKKVLLICLALVFTFSLSSMCFAETTTDGSINLTTEQNAASFVYPSPEPNPLAAAAGTTTKSAVSSSLTVIDEKTPEALPATGGVPEEAFYAVGAILVIGALVILMKKSKTVTK